MKRLLAGIRRLRHRQYPVSPTGVLQLPESLRDRVFAQRRDQVGAVVIHVAPNQRFAEDVQQLINSVTLVHGQPDVIEAPAPEIVEMWKDELQRSRAASVKIKPNYQRVLERIFADAVEAGASDIKLIESAGSAQVRIVVAGQEIDWREETVSTGEGRKMISHLFSMRDVGSGLVALEKATFGGFSIQANSSNLGSFQLPEKLLKIRGQKGYHEQSDGEEGYHIAARLLYTSEKDIDFSLEQLGHDGETLAAMASARARMKGAVIIGGETGDGKSTSIVRNIHDLVQEKECRTSIMTIEDPVEYTVALPGVIQIPVSAGKDGDEREENFRNALMHFVRCNPQVGLVSEIRDVHAARQVLQFIESGHQVWTTIHVNSASTILFRMIDMGVEPPELARPDAIQLLTRQVLVPVLCPECRRQHPRVTHWKVRNSQGCATCLRVDEDDGGERRGVARDAWAGYQRLMAVSEIIRPDDEYLSFVQRNDALGAKRHWLAPASDGGMGGLSVPEKLTNMVNAGLIDVGAALKKGCDPEPRRADRDPEKLRAHRAIVEGYDFAARRLPTTPPTGSDRVLMIDEYRDRQ